MPVPADWRTRPDVRAAVDARIAAATEAGLRLLVERYRYHWTPSCGLPARPDRLVYRGWNRTTSSVSPLRFGCVCW